MISKKSVYPCRQSGSRNCLSPVLIQYGFSLILLYSLPACVGMKYWYTIYLEAQVSNHNCLRSTFEHLFLRLWAKILKEKWPQYTNEKISQHDASFSQVQQNLLRKSSKHRSQPWHTRSMMPLLLLKPGINDDIEKWILSLVALRKRSFEERKSRYEACQS